jgi:3,4-dihydroxy 2-butanone 4-phosphate synthase/GTP cyclohydrolase II
MTAALSAPIKDIIADIRAGRMVVLVDEEDRENEGDLVLAAEYVTPEAINFMAKHGRGLICLTLTEARCRQLNLPLMVRDNRSPHGTAFTLSIEAAEGVTTGISAHDRARTVQAAVAAHAARRHRPARPHLPADGAERRRAGARRPHRGRLRPRPAGRLRAGGGDLRDPQGRRHHGAAARPGSSSPGDTRPEDRRHRRPDPLPQRERDAGRAHRREGRRLRPRRLPPDRLPRQDQRRRASRAGEGRNRPEAETLVRVHEPITVLDFLDCQSDRHSFSVDRAMRTIAKQGSGVIVLLRRASSTPDLLAALQAKARPPTPAAKWDPRLYGIGAQILRDLGVRRMKLLASPRKMPSMAGFQLEITGYLTPEDAKA